MGERGGRWEGKERLEWAGGLRGAIRYNAFSCAALPHACVLHCVAAFFRDARHCRMLVYGCTVAACVRIARHCRRLE